jgi:large subunit ribosomal protein L15
MNLSLQPAEGSTHSQKKRLGRGEGSGKGGTSSRSQWTEISFWLF